jgi:DNA repair exonuclease SbcCD nuclease subunit
MKIIHTADQHLGRSAFSKLDGNGANLRQSLIYENHLAGIERIIQEKPDAVVVAGDQFDTVKPPTKAVSVALRGLEMLREAGIPVVEVVGNHDMQKNGYTANIYEVLTHAHPEIHAAFRFRYEKFEIGDTVFHCIPNMLHAADYLEEARKIEISKDHKNVLVTHGLASTIRDKRLSTVAEFELTPEVLGDCYNYVALGHYHGQVQVGPNAWYSGSQEYLTYGEIADKKGALLVDLDRHSVEHFSLPRSPMKDLGTINCADLATSDIVDEVQDAVGLLDGVGDQMLQITLDFGSNPVRAVPVEALADIREQVLDLKIRIRSQETERQETSPQDIHAINYVEEFERFTAGRQLNDEQREATIRLGQEALRTAIAQHSEVGE